jgi:pilus assembly protein CpaB
LGLAVVLGLTAMVVARGMLGKSKGPAAVSQVMVVVAKDNVPPGSRLTREMLSLSPVAGDARPEGTFDQVAAVADRVVTTQIVKGQMVLDTFLAAPGSVAGVQNLVPEGMRLITVEVNEFSSLAGMLAPGSRVDILAALSDPETKEMMARTIVENVKVQAVGQRLGTGPQASPNGQPAEEQQAGFRSVTLVVSPQEAEAIHVSTTAGRPWMVLRGPGDNSTNRSPGVRLAELRGNAKMEHGQEGPLGGRGSLATLTQPTQATTQPVALGGKKPGRTITFIKGGKAETITIEADTATATTTTPVEKPVAPVEAGPKSSELTNTENGPLIRQ